MKTPHDLYSWEADSPAWIIGAGVIFILTVIYISFFGGPSLPKENFLEDRRVSAHIQTLFVQEELNHISHAHVWDDELEDDDDVYVPSLKLEDLEEEPEIYYIHKLNPGDK